MRRMGSTPQQRGSIAGGDTCPDVIKDADGSYLVIGAKVDATGFTLDMVNAAVGDGEGVVRVPRDCMLDAARQIVEEELASGE